MSSEKNVGDKQIDSSINLADVMQEIRRRAAVRRQAHPELEQELIRVEGLHPNGERKFLVDMEAALDHSSLSQDPTRLPAHTRFKFLKQTVLRLIRVYTRGQIEYNSAVRCCLDALYRWSQENSGAIERLKQEQAEMIDLVRTFSGIQLEDKPYLRQELNMIRAERTGSGSLFNRFAFAEEFYGSEREAKQKWQAYVELFEHHEPVVVLSCGRGEFLELLREAGISATGVESDPVLARHVRQKDLEVEEKDLLDFLRERADESLGGVFAARILERLDWPNLILLLALMRDKISSGGIAVLVGLNPACMSVYAESLYVDPTHLRPYHPHGIQFLCRNLGFLGAEIGYSDPVSDQNRIAGSSPYQHYAVICRK
ncbi:MAG: class I SAM-dependent methyltransferase [Acidobacteria bacterium]|nr:class I SAM-dependent methyltransferase [Acidobacteriota bacterium]